MKRTSLLFILFFIGCYFITYSQMEIEKNYNTFDEFLHEQHSKIDSITNGMNKAQVIAIMGSEMIVKIPRVGNKKPLTQLFKQPEFSNDFNSNITRQINILWYFSTPKDRNGIISKGECTPVIIENDSVVGKGWPFFNSYRKTVLLR